MDNPSQPVDCLRCRHFHITWEADHPRGCRAMGFKTALWPWQEVLRSSGGPCLKFEPKPQPSPVKRAVGMSEGEASDPGRTTDGRFSTRV